MNETTSLFSPTARIVDHLWFFEIVIGILVLLGLNYLCKRIVRYVRQRSLSKTTHDWKGKIDEIFFLPFQILLWVLGITLVIEILGNRLGFLIFDTYIDSFRVTGFVACFAWMLLRWKGEFQKDWLQKGIHHKTIDAAFVHMTGKILSAGILLISLMIVLQVWGLNIGPLIAFGGVGAAALGFAAKDVIANFFGGLMLHINRPFMHGDTIIIPTLHIEGQVEGIGWYLTSVRDKEKRPVYVPNAIFSSGLVINPSRMTHRRIEQTLSLRYEDFPKISQMSEELRSELMTLPFIDPHLPVIVSVKEIGDSGFNLYIDVYTLVTRYEEYSKVRQEMLFYVYGMLEKTGIELAVSKVAIEGKLSPV